MTWVTRWPVEPTEVQAEIEAETNPLQKALGIAALTEAYPGQTMTLCMALDQPEARTRCERLNERPHLWVTKPKDNPGLSSLPETQAPDVDCLSEDTQAACRDRAARLSALQGRVDEARAHCNALSTPQWAGECLFQAAEFVVHRNSAAGYAVGAVLCEHAKPFATNCLNHLVLILADGAPASSTSNPDDWAKIHSADNAVRAHWSWQDSIRAKDQSDRLWSEALGLAYSNATKVTGDPLDALGTAQMPHIFAGTMQRLMTLDPPASRGLTQWVELAQTHLSERSHGTAHREQRRIFRGAADLWGADTEGESVAYLATSRRWVSKNPSVDLAICALEAAARKPPFASNLLEDARTHESLLVQNTAARLVQLIEQDQSD